MIKQDWNTEYAARTRATLLRVIRQDSDKRERSSRRYARRLPTQLTERPMLTNILVTGAVVAISAIAITHVSSPEKNDIPASSPSGHGSADLGAVLMSLLPTGTALEPALTYTEDTPGATGGPLDTFGKTPTMVAACTGGGSIVISISHYPKVIMACSEVGTVGPRTLKLNNGPLQISVAKESGHPHYLVKILAVDSRRSSDQP